MPQAPSLRVVSLESRQGHELVRLLERNGLSPIEAPSLREVPLEDQAEAFAFGDALLRGECDLLVLLTGAGARTLLDALASRLERGAVLAALARVPIACRGPKPVVVLKELGLKPSVVAKEPNTWRELVQALSPRELSGRRVYVQEYGRSNPELLAALRERGAEVQSAAVYAWQLPLDLAPLERAVRKLSAGDADAIVFTSGQQLEHLLLIAERLGEREALLRSLGERVLVGSIGPLTSEALRKHGVSPDLEPEHPKMGHLVKALATDGARLLAAKRSR